jgi:pyochelin synthetase
VPHIEVDHTILTGPEPPPIRSEHTTADLAYNTSRIDRPAQGRHDQPPQRGQHHPDINDRWHAGPADRAFTLSALGFDLSVYDIFGLLAAGGAIVLPTPDTERAPSEWTDPLNSTG